MGAEPAKSRPWWRPATAGVTIRIAATIAAVVVAVGAAALLRRPPPRPDGLVVLYGDSLSAEAAPAFVDELARITDAEVVVRAVPAEAPCDAHDEMQDDLALRPTVVVIQFVGNSATRCTLDPDGDRLEGRALVDRTVQDVRAATEMFATNGSRVVLVGGPDVPGLPGNPGLGVAEAYNGLVNEWAGRDLGRVRYADAAATVTGPDHAFTETLPCRSDEGEAEGCRDGRVVVRSEDRIHFCPGAASGPACPVPSPGARRFGLEMARVTRMALGDY
ncbi:MAG TPA: hypothetical protein VFZ30_08795 [Acidimicrobiales bacterium]